MAARTASKNNIIAGSFLLVSLVLAIGVSVILSGVRDRLVPTREYTVRFPLAEGAAGLKPGSKVLLGGYNVGRVTRLEIAETPGQPSLDVGVRVRTGIALFENARFFLERPLLGSASEINITHIGEHRTGAPFSGASDALEPGETVPGHVAPPAFLAQAGFGPEQAEKVRAIIDQVASVADQFEDMVSRVEPQIGPAVDAVRGAAEDVRAASTSIREKMPGWTDQVDGILASADSAAAKAPSLLDDARKVVADVQGVVDDNRPRIDRTFSSIESAAAKVDTETIDLLNRDLAIAETNLSSAGKVIADLSGYLREQMPGIRRIIANFRLASDQLKLVTVEVRRNPWRLLYRPATKELEQEMLYDAARSYAEAVSDLRAASESLESAAASPGGLPTPDRESLEALRQQIQDAFQRYQEAERAFLQRAEGQSK